MKHPLAIGDMVAWTEHDRGIIVAGDVDDRARRRFTVAVWRAGGFSGHVTRLPSALLHRTSRLRPAPPPRVAAEPADGHS